MIYRVKFDFDGGYYRIVFSSGGKYARIQKSETPKGNYSNIEILPFDIGSAIKNIPFKDRNDNSRSAIVSAAMHILRNKKKSV